MPRTTILVVGKDGTKKPWIAIKRSFESCEEALRYLDEVSKYLPITMDIEDYSEFDHFECESD